MIATFATSTGPSFNLLFFAFLILGTFVVVMALSGSKSRSGTNPLLRFIWFIFIGWWLGILWFGLSLVLMLTIIFLPVGAWAMTKTWKVMTLAGSSGPRDAVTDVSVDVENKMKQQVSGDERKEESSDDEDEFNKLEKLKDLKEDGVITEEEFKEKKEDLMEDI